MTPLHAELAALIAAEGPLPLDRYMALCLGHPRFGYYLARDAIGAAGDFTTAPEISQVFGELIGFWAAAAWEDMGRPGTLRLVECGPGRGTLIKDLLRAARVLPAFRAAIDLHLVETSPRLAALQRQAVTASGKTATWHADLGSVPPGPAIIIGNEFLDALPIRQFVATSAGWRERVVGLDGDRLAFGLAPDPVPPALLARFPAPPAAGAVAEIRPAFAHLAATLGARLPDGPLSALFIDYGHADHAYGDTFQAVRAHAFADPLARPGEADLTAHVDFAALGEAAREAGLAASRPVRQRDLLFMLGLEARTQGLMQANRKKAKALLKAVERLIDPAPTGMGTLFKAQVLHAPGLAVPVFDS